MSARNSPIEALDARRLLSVGDLDLTFGHNGLVHASLDGLIPDQIVAQPDGKFLVDGTTGIGGQGSIIPTLLRLNPDGSRDKSFGGGDGKITLARGRAQADFTGMSLQSDGRILVSLYDLGDDGKGGFVARLKTDGSLDSSFGNGGLVSAKAPGSLCITSDGIYFTDGTLVRRVKSNGANDPAWKVFDVATVQDETNQSYDGYPLGVLPAANHHVWVYGQFTNDYFTDVFVFQLNNTGAFEQSPGLFQFDHGIDERLASAAGGPGGSIAILEDFESHSSGVEMINAAGKVVLNEDLFLAPQYLAFDPNAFAITEDAFIQRDGKLLVSGLFLQKHSFGTTVLRYNPDGSLDESFSFDGEMDLFNQNLVGFTQSKGKLLAITPKGIVRLVDKSRIRSNSVTIQGNDLIVGGTSHADRITLSDSGSGKSKVVIVNINGNKTVIARSKIHDALIAAGDGNDTVDLSGTSLGCSVNGQNGNDSLRGGKGNDEVYGESGNDTLDGGPGNDTFAGGAGRDTITYASRTKPITLKESKGGQKGETDFGIDQSEILILGKADDYVELTDSPNTTAIFGGAGNDTLAVSGSITLHGGAGNDTLTVTSTSDPGVLLLGEAGNDTMSGGIEADTFVGGAGVDTVVYSSSRNLVLRIDGMPDSGGVDEDDRVDENDQIMGDVENLIGGSGNDLIEGNPSNNSLVGGDGNDTIYAGDGNDTLEGGLGHDHLFGQGGNDLLLARDITHDTLDGGDGFDTAVIDDTAAFKDQAVNVEAFI